MYSLHSNGKYWQVQYRVAGQIVTRSLGAKSTVSKRAAKQLIQQLIQSHIDQGVHSPKTQTLGSWLDRYIALRTDLSRSSMHIHKRVCNSLLDHFGDDRDISTITRAEMSDWRAVIQRECAESTVCKLCRTAKVIFNRAVDEDVLDKSPAAKLKGTAPVQDPFSRRLVTGDEVAQVLAIPGEHKIPVGIGWFSGLRTSEIVHLRCGDVDLEAGKLIVRVRGKLQTTKQRGREVRLEPGLRDILPQTTGNPSSSVCGLLESGRKNLLARLVRSACETAGVNPFTLRDLRRARDTIWHMEYPSHVCCAWLGHSESVARQHYLAVPDQYYSPTNTERGNGPGGTGTHPFGRNRGT